MLSTANLIEFAKLLMYSDDSGDSSTVSAVMTSTTSSSYAVMAAAQVKYAGGNCNPLLQVCVCISCAFTSTADSVIIKV